MRDLSAEGKSVLFVGTKKQAQESIREEAEPRRRFLCQRPLAGRHAHQLHAPSAPASQRLAQLRKMEEDGTFDLLPKKEVIKLQLEIEKLEKFPGRH